MIRSHPLNPKDLVRNNFLVSGDEAPACRRRFSCGLSGTNKDEATPKGGVDRQSKSGSYFGPDPKSVCLAGIPSGV
jgi:hypothetical protein